MRERRGSSDHREYRPQILELIERWKRLCESDIDRMLHPPFVLLPTLRSMARDRLIRLEHIGDEEVAIITDQGRSWLRRNQQSQVSTAASTGEQTDGREPGVGAQPAEVAEASEEARSGAAEDAAARPEAVGDVPERDPEASRPEADEA